MYFIWNVIVLTAAVWLAIAGHPWFGLCVLFFIRWSASRYPDAAPTMSDTPGEFEEDWS